MQEVKLFQKTKRGLELVSLLIVCMIFEEKYFSYFILSDQISMSDCLYFVKYWAICVM